MNFRSNKDFWQNRSTLFPARWPLKIFIEAVQVSSLYLLSFSSIRLPVYFLEIEGRFFVEFC